MTVPTLAWEPCGDAEGVQCASAQLPLDYDHPRGEQVSIAVAKSPAKDQEHRIGSLFFNFGGPGAPAVDTLEAVGADLLPTLNERFDVVAFDPRGVGQSEPSIVCDVDQITTGVYSEPIPTPLDVDRDAYTAKVQGYLDACDARNGEILDHVSTANVARDLDALRAAVGDEQLTYLGYSYGTFLGSTYASLFPERMRALVLDGPVDATEYVNDPISGIAEQTAGFERALARFEEACAVDQVACSGFGGTDPSGAFDRLISAADAQPIPADGYAPDPRPVTGDDVRVAALALTYSKGAWGLLGQALAQAAAGDGSGVRLIADEYFYGRAEDGTFDPISDRYFMISASEQRYPDDPDVYFDRGAESWASFPHFWVNSGYAELNWGLWRHHDRDAYAGPFRVPADAATPLVVATTYDPATPYPGALRLVQDLGNARLLTMEGDGHTAYPGNTACVDTAVEAYLVDVVLPAEGTVCQQELPFTAPEPEAAVPGSGQGGAGARLAGQLP